MAKNTVDRPNWDIVQKAWIENHGDLRTVFLKLNWGHSTVKPFNVKIDESQNVEVTPISSLHNFHAFEIPLSVHTPNSVIRKLQKEIAKTYPDNVLIIKDANHVRFEWPRRKPDGGIKYDTFTTGASIPNQLTCQKLAGVGFGVLELGSISLENVRSRVYGLASEDVTKKFYDRFRKEHKNIALAISSKTEISDPDRQSYSSLLLNRLMFVYFLQKKEFLHNDVNLLRNGLNKCEDESLNFYRDALLPLFFEGFNGQNQSFSTPQLDDLWGKIPYINGGIFAPHRLESAADFEIPNSAFAELFQFFDSFNWHLDSRPLGSNNEINPEVLGYIFEQYINEIDGKKEGGAYYTPEDVTGYMVAQTLIPRVLDDFVKIWPGCLSLVKAHPEDYLHRPLQHGRSTENPELWIEAPAELQQVWENDPVGWNILDEAETLDDLCLPGETWVETFFRRERVDKLLGLLREKGITEVNELITHNLNGARLVSEIIAQADNSNDLVAAWNIVTDLSVIDPTCGSGAFLFAALTSLESIYEDLLDALGDERQLVGDQFANGNVKYKIRKHVAMRNLYGTDLMADAVETAKLRIFLSLAAVLADASEIEPLPDLDFNLKTGNLVIGLYDMADVKRINKDAIFEDTYNTQEIRDLTGSFQRQFREFKAAELDEIASVPELKIRLLETQSKLRDLTNSTYIELAGVDQRAIDKWLSEAKPFHWFAEFPEIIENGGFDVVIGNPPYIRVNKLDQYSRDAVATFSTRKSPDFYAICYERALTLLSASGRQSFIVMLNLSFSDQYSALREAIFVRGFSEWWSTFGKMPTQLFRGVQVTNTLLVLGPGSDKYATHHHIFTDEVRKNLFPKIAYERFERTGSAKPIRGGIVENLFREIAATKSAIGASTANALYLRPTGRYWFPILFGNPPVLNRAGGIIHENDTGVKVIALSINEDPAITGAILAGKISYAWWSATGDDFHVNPDEADLPRTLARMTVPSEKLLLLAEAVKEAGRNSAFVSQNNDGYVNVRWSAVRNVTDEFDRAVLEANGLISFWRPLNVWYRQCMRSTRENYNSRYLTPEEIKKYLDW